MGEDIVCRTASDCGVVANIIHKMGVRYFDRLAVPCRLHSGNRCNFVRSVGSGYSVGVDRRAEVVSALYPHHWHLPHTQRSLDFCGADDSVCFDYGDAVPMSMNPL